MPATAGMNEPNPQVGGGQVRPRPVGPFDQTDPAIGKVFVQTRIDELFRNIEPIEIKVI